MITAATATNMIANRMPKRLIKMSVMAISRDYSVVPATLNDSLISGLSSMQAITCMIDCKA